MVIAISFLLSAGIWGYVDQIRQERQERLEVERAVPEEIKRNVLRAYRGSKAPSVRRALLAGDVRGLAEIWCTRVPSTKREAKNALLALDPQNVVGNLLGIIQELLSNKSISSTQRAFEASDVAKLAGRWCTAPSPSSKRETEEALLAYKYSTVLDGLLGLVQDMCSALPELTTPSVRRALLAGDVRSLSEIWCTKFPSTKREAKNALLALDPQNVVGNLLGVIEDLVTNTDPPSAQRAFEASEISQLAWKWYTATSPSSKRGTEEALLVHEYSMVVDGLLAVVQELSNASQENSQTTSRT